MHAIVSLRTRPSDTNAFMHTIVSLERRLRAAR